MRTNSTIPKIALRHIFSIVNGATPDSQNPAYWEGDVPWVTPEDLSKRTCKEISESKRTITEAGYRSCGTTTVPAGSIVLSTRAPIGNLAIAERPVCTNQGCKSLVPAAPVSTKYFYYQLSVLTEELNRKGRGTTFLELSTNELGAFKVYVPPLSEQDRIANFLDEQTARIDALIAEKSELLEKLKEYRLSVATAAVTRGCPGVHAEFKQHAFLGEIPTAWKAGKFRHYVEFRSGQVDPESPKYSSMVLIAPNHIEAGTGRLLDTETALQQAAESGKYWCDAGDVIYSKIRPGLRKATLAPYDCLCSADMYPLKGTGPLTTKYLYWYLLSEPFSVFAVQESMRVAMPKLNRETMADAIVPLPSIEEQGQIVEYVEGAVASIDKMCSHAIDHVARLREYRASLISAAVTGQLDINSYQEAV